MKKLLLILLCLPMIGLGQDMYKILGWSKDGIVAYTLSYSDNDDDYAADFDEDYPQFLDTSYFGIGVDYQLIIQDIKTDKILDSYVIEYSIDECISVIKKYDIIYDTINKFYEVEYSGNTAEIIDPFILNTYTDVSYNIRNMNDCWPDNEGPSYTCKTHTFISNSLYTEKYLGSLQSNECWSPYSVLGYYKSPFENRILLVFASGIILEGENDTFRYEFMGCSLNSSTFR